MKKYDKRTMTAQDKANFEFFDFMKNMDSLNTMEKYFRTNTYHPAMDRTEGNFTLNQIIDMVKVAS